MLSERLQTLYTLLQCKNTDIARFAGCTPGNISRLRTGKRVPSPASRTVWNFARGIYDYADYENMIPVLCELCRVSDSSKESLVPALIGWLYQTEDFSMPKSSAVPQSRKNKDIRTQSFGGKLDRVMTLLELTNSRLAALLNIDASLVSRYRSGIYTPFKNEQLSERLSNVLLNIAEKNGKTAELAEICKGMPDTLSLTSWFYEADNEDESLAARRLLHSLENISSGQKLQFPETVIPEPEERSFYRGTDGLRSAVIRFLSDAADKGGELMLYSDEPMEWMSGDPEYFTIWASLMRKCINNGVKIKIIHNVDRQAEEMIDAIQGWFPLYISGMIEPYVFRKERSQRFCHTVFLHEGNACIFGFFPTGAGDERWYEYFTDQEKLDALDKEYRLLLSSASPLLKTYTVSDHREYNEICHVKKAPETMLVSGFPVFTMPQELFRKMISKAKLSEKEKAEAYNAFSLLRNSFIKELEQHSIHMIVSVPPEETPRRLNCALNLLDFYVEYTPGEFALHTDAIKELVLKEQNFHLTLLPEAPFNDIQIVTFAETVSVLRCRRPYAAFVFMNHELEQSLSGYLDNFIKKFTVSRQDTVRMLSGAKPPVFRL